MVDRSSLRVKAVNGYAIHNIVRTRPVNRFGGIAISKDEGKYKGRKPLEIDEEQFKDVCARWRADKVTAIAAMKEVGSKPNTFYRRVKEMSL